MEITKEKLDEMQLKKFFWYDEDKIFFIYSIPIILNFSKRRHI